MNIHEYQAKKILSDFGVTIPRGGIAYIAQRMLKTKLEKQEEISGQ